MQDVVWHPEHPAPQLLLQKVRGPVHRISQRTESTGISAEETPRQYRIRQQYYQDADERRQFYQFHIVYLRYKIAHPGECCRKKSRRHDEEDQLYRRPHQPAAFLSVFKELHSAPPAFPRASFAAPMMPLDVYVAPDTTSTSLL